MQASDAYENALLERRFEERGMVAANSGGTNGSCFGASREDIKAFPREAVNGFLGVRHLIIRHEVREDPAILLIVDGLLNVPRDNHLQLMHEILHVVAHVISKIRSKGNSGPRRGDMSHHIGTIEEVLDPVAKVGRPSLLVNEPHRLPKGVLRDDVGGVAVEGFLDVEHPLRSEQLVTRALREVVDLALELQHLSSGEEPVHGEPPRPV